MNTENECMINDEWRDEPDRTEKVVTTIVFIYDSAPLGCNIPNPVCLDSFSCHGCQSSCLILPWLSSGPLKETPQFFKTPTLWHQERSRIGSRFYRPWQKPNFSVCNTEPVTLAIWGSHVGSIIPTMLMAFRAHCGVLRKESFESILKHLKVFLS